MRDIQLLEAKYARILRERTQHADQSVDEFCRVHGIAPWTYYYWKRRLRQAPVSKGASLPVKNFLPLQLISPSPKIANGEGGMKYEITFPNGVTVHLSGTMQREDHAVIIGTVAAIRA
jgi:hypothetical protein